MGKIVILCVCFCGMAGMLAVICHNNRHPPGGMKGGREETGWLRFFYSTAYVVHRFIRGKMMPGYPEEKIQKLQQIQIGKTQEELEEFYDCQRIGGIFLLMLFTMGMVLLSVFGENSRQLLRDAYALERGEPGEGDRQVHLQVKADGREREMTVTIPERQYQREELEAKFTEAKEFVKKTYLGENPDSEHITKPLMLMSRIPDNQIQIRWRLDSNGYVNKDGSLNNGDLQEETQILLTAVLSYGEEKQKMPLPCIIHPAERTEEEMFWEAWHQEAGRQEEQTARDSSMMLPRKIADRLLSYQEIHRTVWPQILFAGFICCVLLPVLFDYQTEQRVMKREQELRREYPEIVERFILLIGAGLTIRGAWYRITDDYQNRRQKNGYMPNYLYEEMLITRRELDNGQNEAAAYAAFGRRLSMLQYMKFSTLLVQNLKKGSDDLLKRMDMEAVDALRERREMAKRFGEEAGTKLLFPMIMMLVVVFAMILIAAFNSM